MRRVVLENYNPTIADLSRILEGKARDFRVKTNDLLSEGQILNCIFTRIIETDLIAQNQRENILSRLISILEEAENTPISESSVIDFDRSKKAKTFIRFSVPLTMAIIASGFGSIITLLPTIQSSNLDINNITELLSITMALSMTIIMAVYIFKRMKESQQDIDLPSRSKSIEKAIEFEREVAKLINKFATNYKASGPQDSGYDFEIVLNNKIILIEVKAWSQPAPMQILTSIAQRLAESVQKVNANKGIIVTKFPSIMRNLETDNGNIEAMTLSEFKSYLKNNKQNT